MNRIAAVVAGLSLAFVGTSTTFADTINVPADYPTIQGAINASSNGDVITIAAGTYNEHSLLPPADKAITIQGTVNGDGTLATTIDAQQAGSVFVVNSGEGNGTVIRDLVITGGSTSGGGGINCNFSSPTISGCHITGNTATYYGGGIYCGGSNPTISGCTILGNSAEHGGGIYSYESNPHLIGCSVSDNTNYTTGDTSNISGTVTQSLRGEQIDLGTVILEDSTVCGTGEHISGVLIEHRGENHISDCVDEGDLNGDGAIDSTDLDAMHAAVGICTSDVNHDGDTNVLDLLGVIDEWGGVCP
ncbi:MAG: hypothetical protein VX727_03330 [Planctomycetota bacterium]|nr:hypothetical protein [Planctomycetota bacterium]